MKRLILVLVFLALAPSASAQAVDASAIYLKTASATCKYTTGSGAPTGGASCDEYRDTATGRLYYKFGSTWASVPGLNLNNTFLTWQAIAAANPFLLLTETGASSNNKNWRWNVASEVLSLQTLNDALDTIVTVPVSFTRAGAATFLTTVNSTGYLVSGAAANNSFLKGNGSVFTSATGSALTKTDDTNVTLTLGGSPTIALVNAASITAGWTGRLAASRFLLGAANSVLAGNGASDAGFTATPTLTSLTTTSTITDGSLTATRCTFAGTGGLLADDADCTFTSGDTLTATKVIAPTSLTTPLITTAAATNLAISPTGDIVTNPTGKDILPNAGYDINIGALSNKYLTLHAAELWVETLVAQNTIATMGGRFLVGPTNILCTDIGTGTTAITVKYNSLTVDDVVYMEANGKVEYLWVRADDGPSACGGVTGEEYQFSRNLDGSGANVWNAGDAVFNTGQVGSGFIDLYSVAGVKSGSEAGPTIVGNVRNSLTYNDWSPRWAIGNLNGLYGYATNIYGFAAGDPTAANVVIDATNGYRMRNGTTLRQTLDGTNGLRYFRSDGTTVALQLDMSGNAAFTGMVTAGAGAIGGFSLGPDYVRDAANSMGMESTVTGGDDCRFWAGDTYANCAIAPFHIFESGKMVAGPLVVDSNGVNIPAGGAFSAVNSYSFDTTVGTGGGVIKMSAYSDSASVRNLTLSNVYTGSGTADSNIVLLAQASSTTNAASKMTIWGSSTFATGSIIDANTYSFNITANGTANSGKLTVAGTSVLTGNVTMAGTLGVTGAITGALTGNASTATTLQTARNICGQSFNGSAAISLASTCLTDTATLPRLASANVFTDLQEIATAGASNFGTLLYLHNTAGTDGPRLTFEAYASATFKTWNVGIRQSSATSFGIFENGTTTGFGTERFTILAGGAVGVGTTGPTAKFHVQAASTNDYHNFQLAISDSATSTKSLRLGYVVDTGLDLGIIQAVNVGIAYQNLAMQPYGGNIGIGTTSPTHLLELASDDAGKPSTSTWTIVSDRRSKTNITQDSDLAALTAALVAKMRLVKIRAFDFNGQFGTEKDRHSVGPIADEVQTIFPSSVKLAMWGGVAAERDLTTGKIVKAAVPSTPINTLNKDEMFTDNVAYTQFIDGQQQRDEKVIAALLSVLTPAQCRAATLAAGFALTCKGVD